jgi:nucleoside recognition membrane protein YjiH
MFAFAAIGIFFFFITITIGGESSIPLDHLVTFFKDKFPKGIKYYAFLVIIGGGVFPFIKGTWKDSTVDVILSILKIIGIVFASMYIFHFGPQFLFEKDMMPFLFNNLVISVGLIVPLGAIFLSFLIDYGLLELVGVIMQPIMRRVWKTPGKSAVDAVASFVGSYSIGLLITGKVYKNGGYSFKEAAIIATGFSTVSATFMIIVAKTLDLMHLWNVYFWMTIFITFIVTAITARIYPIKRMNHFETESDLVLNKGNLNANKGLNRAFESGLKVCSEADNLFINIKSNFIAGLIMTMSILASIMSVGTIGLILAKFTPFFDIMGYLFYPFAWITNIPEPVAFSKAIASSLAEMFLPALILKDAELVSRFTAGIASISSILFFSASIPCILSTGIPISIKDLVVIWIERVILTILIAAPTIHLLIFLKVIY